MLLAKADALVAALRERGLEHRDTLRVGRTHGIHAEPDVFGHRLADLAFGAGPVPRPAAAGPGRRSRWPRSAARWGRTRTSTRRVEAAVAAALGLRAGRRGRPRWCCGTASPSGCRRWRSWPRSARRSRSRCGTGSAPRCGSWPSRSARGRRAPARCRTRRTRSCPSGSPAWPGSCGRRCAGHGGHPALARAGHLALLDRADRAAGRRDRHRLPAAPDHAGWSSGLVVDADRMRANLESTGGLIYTSAVLLDLVGPACPARTRTR